MATRVLVGHIARVSRYEVLCDGDACVIIGSRLKLKVYLESNLVKSDKSYAIQKAWFDDILAGLRMGGAYAFDEEAYKRFYPLARRAGLKVGAEDFSTLPPPGIKEGAIHLVRVQCL